MKNIKLIKKWAKLKHLDDHICKKVYLNLNHTDRGKFMAEVESYLRLVELGIIKESKLKETKSYGKTTTKSASTKEKTR